jgi:hypothetical protein
MFFKRRTLIGLLTGLVLLAVGLAGYRSFLNRPKPVARQAGPPPPAGIVIHHSATPGVVGGQYVGAALIDRSHKRRGYAVKYRGKLYHIGYHYVIREDGVIEPGRPEHCPGAHSKTFNDYLGICLVGHFSSEDNRHFWTPSEPTPAQIQSLLWLCGRLMAKYQIPTERVVRHSDLRDTVCPGDRFPYAWVQAQLRPLPVPSPVPSPRTETHISSILPSWRPWR